MHTQPSLTCQHFLTATDEDLPVVKLFKYRYFLSTYEQPALQLFSQLTTFALDKRLLGEYELIHETAKQAINKSEPYRQQRQEMIDTTNVMRQQTEHAEAISSMDDMIAGYYRLATYYRGIGMHKDAASYYSKLFRCQSGAKVVHQRGQYFSEWAQELYLDNNWGELNIFIRNELEDPKAIDATLALIKDLKFIEMGHGRAHFFENVLNNTGLTLTAILNNSCISYTDLGVVYSLVALATQDRATLKRKVSWSGKLQVLYLQNNFVGMLTKITHLYETQGKFHPLIDKMYNNLLNHIRERVLQEFLSVYHTVALTKVTEHTTFSEGELSQFLLRNAELPYLIDPITQTVIHKEKSLPLYQETVEYSYKTREKFRELIRSCISAKRVEEGSEIGKGKRGMFGGKSMFDDDE